MCHIPAPSSVGMHSPWTTEAATSSAQVGFGEAVPARFGEAWRLEKVGCALLRSRRSPPRRSAQVLVIISYDAIAAQEHVGALAFGFHHVGAG